MYVPVFRLIEAGWKVDIAAPEEGKITGESNWYYVIANKRIDEIDPDEYDLLVLPGGKPDGAPTTVRNNSRAVEIARSFFASNKPVAAICHGPYLLVSADLVKGRRLTSYWRDGVPEEITNAGGTREDVGQGFAEGLVVGVVPGGQGNGLAAAAGSALYFDQDFDEPG